MSDPFTHTGYDYNRGGRVTMICRLCGSVVADMDLHDRFHWDLVDGGEGEVITGEIVETGNDAS